MDGKDICLGLLDTPNLLSTFQLGLFPVTTVPVNIFVLLPATSGRVDRVAKVVLNRYEAQTLQTTSAYLTVLVRYDICPFKFCGASTSAPANWPIENVHDRVGERCKSFQCPLHTRLRSDSTPIEYTVTVLV